MHGSLCLGYPFRLFVFLLAFAVAEVPLDPRQEGWSPVPAARADDDGDDGGGARGGRGGRGDGMRPGSYSNPARSFNPFGLFRKKSRRVARQRTRPAVVQRHAEKELIAFDLSPDDRARLTAEGFAFVDESPIEVAGTVMAKLRVPDGLSLEAARSRVREASPGAVVDFNHYYRPEQGDGAACGKGRCLQRTVVGWPATGDTPSCSAQARIGLIDTAINPEHGAFAGARLETIRLAQGDLPESGRQHGTAIAALLIGRTDGRAPGLLPGATLLAVDAFRKAGSSDRAEAFDLVRALDILAARELGVINMSLAGPGNLLLERAITLVSARGVTLVAAAGNKGPRAEPLYPAAYTPVVAVTAIDRGKRPYRRAGRGDHIDIAAPGVRVWTAASIEGARPKSGTSFAAPFVTAAAALLKASNPQMDAKAIAEILTAGAEDLGKPGKDPVFGWGLLDARTLCAGAATLDLRADETIVVGK